MSSFVCRLLPRSRDAQLDAGDTSRRRAALCAGIAIGAAWLGVACEPSIEVGRMEPTDAADETVITPTDAGADSSWRPEAEVGDIQPLVFPLPFAASFEQETFDSEWNHEAHHCYQTAYAEHHLVTDPVHGGNTAAVFRILQGDVAANTRCYLRGRLSAKDVWFRAFFYVPRPLPRLSVRVGMSSWNILHFKESKDDPTLGLFDVNFIPGANDELTIGGLGLVGVREATVIASPALPLETWFELWVRWTRTTDGSGGWEVYRDGVRVLKLSSVWSGEEYAEFHLGNLTNVQLVPEVRVYIDDLTVFSASP